MSSSFKIGMVPESTAVTATTESSVGFISFCESLWRAWLNATLDLPGLPGTLFDLDAAPEPYLSFGSGRKPLIALTTNPGATMAHQRLEAVRAGSGPLGAAMDYATAARALAAYYERELGGAARNRIAAMRRLASLLDADGVLQVEVSPFHSRSLPKKSALLKTIVGGGWLADYAEHLRTFLRPRPVLLLSAVSTNVLLQPSLTLSPWLQWKASIAGLRLERADFVPLVTKGTKTTAAGLLSLEGNVPKALVLMMGGNHLPAEAGLRVLAAAIAKTC
jgi:hypothetical protein